MYEDVGLSYTGYMFVGLTTFILAYVTINDNSGDAKDNETTAASMIPESISKPFSEMTSSLPSVDSLNPFTSEKKAFGGKRKNRKTKRRR